MNAPIYLDNNATTKIHPEVLEAMMPYLTEQYANPSSGYRASRLVKRAVDLARERVAALLDCETEEIIFTSGGTEADNTAIASAVASLPERKRLVTSAVEHPAVHGFFELVEREEGHERVILPVDELGQIDLGALEAAVDPDKTTLVSLMWANNETGVIFPVLEAAAMAAERGVFFHTDAVQAVGKTPIRVRDSGIHFLALSAHKFHGPKGVGALYAHRNVRLKPRVIGGSQEKNRRGGTENVAGIVGLGKAAEMTRLRLESGAEEAIARARDRLVEGLRGRLRGVRLNGDPACRLCNTANLAFDDVEAAGLLILLDEKGLCASAGSACHTGSLHPSPVLSAMGLSRERALSSLRLSLSTFTTEDELRRAEDTLVACVEKIRSLRPPAPVMEV